MSGFLKSALLILCMMSTQTTQAATRDGVSGMPSPVLEVSSLASRGNEVAIQLDLKALEALESAEIVTSTLWTNGINTFQGVPLLSLLNALNLDGRQLRVRAINDYAVNIPLDDPHTEHAILAYRMNGEPMTRRGKGPLWIVYPFDQSPKFRTETIYARSVWQLNRIEVID